MTTTKRRTGTRRRRTEIKRPAERWLWGHPSWLNWWWFKNAEANPELARLITGVFCIFVESKSGTDSVKHYKDMKERCEALGWTFVPGLRFTHQIKAEWELLKTKREHVKIIQQAKKWPSLMLDMEPYHITSGQRYHSGGEAYELFDAAEPWRKFNKPLFVYPPQMQAPGSIIKHYGYSCDAGPVRALDHSTYEASIFGAGLKRAMWVRKDYYQWPSAYVPGFYLRYLNDRNVMALAATYGRSWFFPHPKTDDRRNFMTPEWAPDKS